MQKLDVTQQINYYYFIFVIINIDKLKIPYRIVVYSPILNVSPLNCLLSGIAHEIQPLGYGLEGPGF